MKKLEKIDKAELEDIFKKITSKFKFNFYEIDEELDVFVTFETMNNRGKSFIKFRVAKKQTNLFVNIIRNRFNNKK